MLTPLTAVLEATFRDEQGSAATTYALVKLLAAVATSTTRNVTEQHAHIVMTLVALLKHPNRQRTVRMYNARGALEDKGSLADAVYTALLQITEGSL